MTRLNPLTLAEKITGRPMAAGTRHYFKDSFFYTAANLAPKLFSFIMTPIVTWKLAEGQYAFITVFSNALIPLCLVLSLQVENSVARYYYEDKKDFPDFLGTQFLFTLAFSALMTAQFFIFSNTWARAFGLPLGVFLWALPTALVTLVHQVYFQLLLVRKESRRYCAWKFVVTLLYVVLGVAFLLALPRQGYIVLIWATLLSLLLPAIPFMGSIFQSMRLVFRREYVRYALHFSLPLLPGMMASFILNFFDKILMLHYDPSLTGQYSFAYTMGMLVSMVTAGLFSAYMPRFYENMNKGDRDASQRMFSRNFKLLLLGAVAMTLLSKPMVLLLGRRPEYHKGMAIIPIIIASYLFIYLYQCHGLYISYRRKLISLQSVALIVSAAVNVAFNIWIWHTPWLQQHPLALMRAVALATLFPSLLQWVMVYFIARVLLKEKTVNFRGITVPFLLYLAFSAFWCFWGYGNP